MGTRVRAMAVGWRARKCRSNDAGAATVVTAVAACALCALFAVVLVLGQAVAARHRAASTADLAALAAADRALWGPGVACGAARRLAEAQDARLVSCSIDGPVADVTAQVASGLLAPVVRSRAGPRLGAGALPAVAGQPRRAGPRASGYRLRAAPVALP
jgi:secretion/DNA translocation related TadE-like protein